MPHSAVALRSRYNEGMVVAWHGRGMVCVNQTRPRCVNQMGKTQSKPLAERHGMCELDFKIHFSIMFHTGLHKIILL
jgi:hypothetical protein